MALTLHRPRTRSQGRHRRTEPPDRSPLANLPPGWTYRVEKGRHLLVQGTHGVRYSLPTAADAADVASRLR